MIDVKYEDAKRVIQEVVDEFGAGYIDPGSLPDGPGCRYVAEGQKPGCIVGQVLFRLGVPIGDLAFVDAGEFVNRVTGAVTKNDTSVNMVPWSDVNVSIDTVAVNALYSAQCSQDSGKPWGRALNAFLGLPDED